MSPAAVLDKVKHSRRMLLQSCRTNMVVEMKRAEEERNSLQLKMSEVTGLKAHLMNAKIEEIINAVVEPERLRALQETDEVTRSTLAADTLPSQVDPVDCTLTEADCRAVDYLSGALKREGLEASSAALAASESQFAAAVHQESMDAVDWASQRQQAAKERNLLHQRRLHVEVKQAFDKTEQHRSHAEKLHRLHNKQDTGLARQPTGAMSSGNTRKFVHSKQPAEQMRIKDAVCGKISVDLNRSSGPVVVMIYANDTAESVASDFCATYDKYSSEAKSKIVSSVERSISLNAQCTEEFVAADGTLHSCQEQEGWRDNGKDAWLMLPEMQVVHVDLRRSY